MGSYNGMNYGDISPRVGMHAVAKFLAHAQPILVLEKFGTSQPLPKNKSQTLKWRRAIPFDTSLVALTEGVTPAPQAMRFEDVTSAISQYGAWVAYTDVVADTHEDPILNEMSTLLSEQAAQVKEGLTWNVLRAGTNVLYTGTATTRATVNAPVQEADLRLATRVLKSNLAKPITRMISASPNIATEPVAPGYIAFGHSNLEADLRDLTGFVPREKYASTSALMDQEIGKFEDIRFILTPHLAPFYGAGTSTVGAGASTDVLGSNGAVDVYPVVIIGQDYFASTSLKGYESAQMAVKNPQMGASFEDPMGQRGFMSWKMWYVVTRLNEAWGVRIEAAARSLT
jgi:N4-gp56 family major capsid protein